MPDRPKRGMDALLAEQREQAAAAAAKPARPARTNTADSSAAIVSEQRHDAASWTARPGISDKTAMASRPSRPARPGSSARLRSWYMTQETASSLARAVDDLHYATRAPKWAVIAAIVSAGLADLSAIEAELRAQQAAPD